MSEVIDLTADEPKVIERPAEIEIIKSEDMISDVVQFILKLDQCKHDTKQKIVVFYQNKKQLAYLQSLVNLVKNITLRCVAENETFRGIDNTDYLLMINPSLPCIARVTLPLAAQEIAPSLVYFYTSEMDSCNVVVKEIEKQHSHHFIIKRS